MSTKGKNVVYVYDQTGITYGMNKVSGGTSYNEQRASFLVQYPARFNSVSSPHYLGRQLSLLAALSGRLNSVPLGALSGDT